MNYKISVRKINLLFAISACIVLMSCGDSNANQQENNTDSTETLKTNLPSPESIAVDKENILMRDSIFIQFMDIAGVSYGDPIEKVYEIYGTPGKQTQPTPNLAYDYYFAKNDSRMLSFQYNPERGNVIESIFYGPEVNVFDSVPNYTEQEEFKIFLKEKNLVDPKVDYLNMEMDAIKAGIKESPLTDPWSLIYETTFMDVKFIRMEGATTCGEVNVFWRYSED